MVRKIVFIGPQGSGKGTQAQMIAEEFGMVYLSTGVVLRQVENDGSDLGNKVKDYKLSGKLVPDEIVNKIVANRIKQNDALIRGYVLDGYPRNISQAKELSKIDDITDVVVLKITDDEAVKRISGRLETKSGKTFHKMFNPPPEKLDEEVYQREDDKEEVVRKRLAIYHTDTEPLIDYYSKMGFIREVNGAQIISEVYKDIKNILKSINPKI
jgi:adenylate kinase